MGISECVTIMLTCAGGSCLIYEDVRIDRTKNRIYTLEQRTIQLEQRSTLLEQMTRQRTEYLLGGLEVMRSTTRARFDTVEQRIRAQELIEHSRPLRTNATSPESSAHGHDNPELCIHALLPRAIIAPPQGHLSHDLIHTHE